MPLSLQLDDSIVWPATVGAAQGEACTRLYLVPNKAVELQVRICIVGHFGVAGYRGVSTTTAKIGVEFFWTDDEKDIEFFVRRCRHCASPLGGQPQPRLLGEEMHPE
ncbi:hypothetical protein PHPALM_30868 [Phytophthora palmivora]|uniref:Integrase zinc-binding domain-containing protein n=1 Tax=Phytophthora palmivora TaxID=4796 RepID=A0A2P4X415_9STRA|nr:hypothetical protein PHPALM_30868 [Phytophthora palmivora]